MLLLPEDEVPSIPGRWFGRHEIHHRASAAPTAHQKQTPRSPSSYESPRPASDIRRRPLPCPPAGRGLRSDTDRAKTQENQQTTAQTHTEAPRKRRRCGREQRREGPPGHLPASSHGRPLPSPPCPRQRSQIRSIHGNSQHQRISQFARHSSEDKHEEQGDNNGAQQNPSTPPPPWPRGGRRRLPPCGGEGGRGLW